MISARLCRSAERPAVKAAPDNQPQSMEEKKRVPNALANLALSATNPIRNQLPSLAFPV